MSGAELVWMNVSLYQAAAALNANARWQELITENLAASAIPGFKKQEMSFSAVAAGVMPASASGSQHYALPHASAVTNFSAGELKFTGVKTDVALEGRGFLAVQMPDGNTAYTRDGELQINAAGLLVTKQGFPVLGDSGPIQLDLSNPAPVSIASGGDVSQGADVKGKLRAVEFDDPQVLTPINAGYFIASNAGQTPRDAEIAVFRQGFLESANTSAVSEMAHLIAAMRMYEANQKVIQTHDERMGRAISEIGNPS